MKLKIYYHNCKREGECLLEVKCPPSEYIAVVNIIKDFKKNYPFKTGSWMFCEELERFGFKAKEMQFDKEIN